MPTQITDLPQEISDMIWNELLLIDHSSFDTGRWKLATQLFTVNKTISAETQAFFYRENAFVLIENFNSGAGTFLREYGIHVFSMKTTYEISTKISRLPIQPKIALRIRLNQGFNKATMGGPNVWEEINYNRPFPPRKDVEQAIISGRHLPRLIQAINCLRSPLFCDWNADAGGRPIYKIDLDFKTSTEDCYRDNGVAERLARGLKGLRQFQIFGRAAGGDCGGSFPTHLISKERPIFKTKFSIKGLDDEKLIQELLQESNTPAWTMQEAIAEAKNLVKQAKILEDCGEYGTAYSTLELSELMIGHIKVAGIGFTGRYISQKTMLEITTILFDILLAFHNLAWNLCYDNRSHLLGPVDARVNLPGIVDRTFDSIVDLDHFQNQLTPFKENSYLEDAQASLHEIEKDFDDGTLLKMKTSLSNLCLRYCRYVLSVGYVSKAYKAIRAGLEKDPGNLELRSVDNEIEETYNYQAILQSENREAIEEGWRLTVLERMWDRAERIRIANNGRE